MTDTDPTDQTDETDTEIADGPTCAYCKRRFATPDHLVDHLSDAHQAFDGLVNPDQTQGLSLDAVNNATASTDSEGDDEADGLLIQDVSVLLSISTLNQPGNE